MTEPQPPIQLQYDAPDVEPIGKRPAWVWIILTIYLLIAAAVVFLPLWQMLFDADVMSVATVTATLFTLSGLGLLFTPVKTARRRPITRRSVWVPILTAGFLLGMLVWGAGIALIELGATVNAPSPFWWGAIIGGGGVWLGWSIVLWIITRRGDPAGLAARFHRWLIGGSVAELLVAVPTHLVCRRRDECCAGIPTGAAIAVGVVVMFVSFGPSVAFLYFKRWKQIQPKKMTNDQITMTNK